MYGVGIAKKIVHIAQNLLISTYKEYTYIIVFALAETMKRKIRRLLIIVDIGRDFAIRVAGYILQSGRHGGFFVQSLNGHDREKLVDAPRVGKRLKKRKVAEVLVGHHLVERTKLIGHMLLMVCQLADFACDTPIKAFNLCTCLEVDNAMTEEVKCFVANILCIVPVLEHGTGRKLVPNFREIVNELMVLLCGMEILVHMGHAHALHHVDHEHGMMSRQRTSTFGNEVGMRNVILIGRINEGVYAVVDIFLNGIVDGTLGIAGARTVVVHSKATTTVDELDVESHGMELHVEL